MAVFETLYIKLAPVRAYARGSHARAGRNPKSEIDYTMHLPTRNSKPLSLLIIHIGFGYAHCERLTIELKFAFDTFDL